LKFKTVFLCGLLLQALLPQLSLAGEAASALKADTLRAEPYADAKSAGNINRGDKLEILSKQGGWLKVKAASKTGWVRLLSVKRSSGAASNSSGVLDLASGRAGTGQVVATTGVRGLSAEELKSAKYNADEIKLLESQSPSASQAKSFASKAGLKAIKLDYLSAPQAGANP
jgi:uncharacterized protein YgiM (DUF1202 family)